MILQGDLMRQENAQNFFYSSFEGKYVIMDNLDERNDPLVKARDEIFNSEYVYVTVVLRGTLNIMVGNRSLEIKSNEYLAVTPCVKVTVKESRCIFFTFISRSYIMADIYERTGVIAKQKYHAFSYMHVHFSPYQTNILLDCYKKVKREHLRENYPLKESVIRAYMAAYASKLFTFIDDNNTILHTKNSKQFRLFNEFIANLKADYMKERSVQYYAQKLGITPKYLSAIVLAQTSITASQMIDQYVVYSIKLTLYKNKNSIKDISLKFNFPSQSFFGRYFKRITGLSPNEYIKDHNIRDINFVPEAN